MKIVVLLSGGGTTLQNLIDKKINVVHVISNKPKAFGLTRAQRADIPTSVVPPGDGFSERILQICRDAGADLVCMAGFLQKLQIPDDFRNKVMNIHPSLIPSFCGRGFYGHRVHEAVLESGVKVSGCTVHFADNEYDHGPIIIQRTCPVLDDDTPDTLAARVFEQECEAYPQAIGLFAENRLLVKGKMVNCRERDNGFS